MNMFELPLDGSGDAEACRLLVEAFQHDAVYRWIYPHPRAFQRLFPHILRAYLEHVRAANGLLWAISSSQNDSLSALAVVLPPESEWPLDLWERFEREHAALLDDVLQLAAKEEEPASSIRNAMQIPLRSYLYHQFYERTKDIREHATYLVLLATASRVRRQGIGSQLLNAVQEKARWYREAKGRGDGTVVLECAPELEEFYQTRGFVVDRVFDLYVDPRMEWSCRYGEETEMAVEATDKERSLDFWLRETDRERAQEFQGTRVVIMKSTYHSV